MTPEDHNKLNGILHLAYGGLQSLIFGGIALFIPAFLAASPNTGGEIAIVGGVIFIIFFVMWLLFALPSLIAGYGMLKRKSWGRIAGIIASVLAVMNVPHGTLLGIYSLWFLFGEKGSRFYDHAATNAYAPPQMNPSYAQPFDAAHNFGNEQQREKVYAPPTQPPSNWR